jgi:hypothetical protein
VTTRTFYHLEEAEYSINFPDALDVVPVLIDNHTWLDGWIKNMLYSAILNIQQFLIDNKSSIEGSPPPG